LHGRSYEFIFNFVPAEQRGQRRRTILLDRFQRIATELITGPLLRAGGRPADYQAGVDLAVANLARISSTLRLRPPIGAASARRASRAQQVAFERAVKQLQAARAIGIWEPDV
jgi:hypothetical protein